MTIIEHTGPQEADGIFQTVPPSDREVDVRHLPENVEHYYREAIRALDAGSPESAAVQLRRTLEAAAAHFGMSQSNLLNRVRGLIAEGLVTKQFGQVLHHVRKLGNLGAHATDERIGEHEARQALRFTTQVLRNLFEIPTELRAVQEGNSGPDALAG